MRFGREASVASKARLGSVRTGVMACGLTCATFGASAFWPRAASKKTRCAKVRESSREDAGRNAVLAGLSTDGRIGRGKRETLCFEAATTLTVYG